MPTVIKRWSFATSAEGLADDGTPASIAFAWQASDSPTGTGGCVKFTSTTASLSNVVKNVYPTSGSETWENWGVPVGAVVTSVRATGYYYRVASATGLTSVKLLAYLGTSTETPILDPSSPWFGYTLDSSTSLSTSASTWTTGPNTLTTNAPVQSAFRASTSTVELILEFHLTTAAGAVNVDVRFDEIELEITYQFPGTPTITRPFADVVTSTNATSYSFTGNWGPATATSALYVMVFAGDTAAAGAMTSNTGSGVSWSLLQSIAYNTTDKAYLFKGTQTAALSNVNPTFTCTGDAASGVVMSAWEIDGSNIKERQSDAEARTGANPTITLPSAMLATSVYLAGFGMPRNPPVSAPPASWTEDFDTGYNVPANGASGAHRSGGETGSTITFTSASAAYGILAVEIYDDALFTNLTGYQAAFPAGADGTTSISVAYPSTQNKDLLLLAVNNKYPATPSAPATPAGWTQLAQATGGAGAAGADSGQTQTTLFYRIADGTETGSFTVTITGANVSVAAKIKQLRLYDTVNYVWALAASTGSDNTANTTWAVTAAADPGMQGGDALYIFNSPNTDTAGAYWLTPNTLTYTGVTIGTKAVIDAATSATGDDIGTEIDAFFANSTSGTSSAAPSFSATVSANTSGSAVFVRIRAANLYTLTGTNGSYSASGQTVNLIRSLQTLTASVGAYALTGNAAAFLQPAPQNGLPFSDQAFGSQPFSADAPIPAAIFTLVADLGSYALAGQNVTFQAQMPAASGSYSLAGQNTVFSKQFTLALARGSYSLTGQTAGLIASRLLTAARGAFTLTGQAASFQVQVPVAGGVYALTGEDALFRVGIPLAAGSYTLAGQNVTFKASRLITAAFGAYALTGQSVQLLVTHHLTADVGSYALVGQDISFAASRVLAAAYGAYSLAGQDASLLANHHLAANAGSYMASGESVLFTVIMPAAFGSYTLTGEDVTFRPAIPLETGLFALSGEDVALIAARTIAASFGSYTLTGEDVRLIASRLLTAEQGSYALTGQDATFTRETRFIDADAGLFALSGQDIALAASHLLSPDAGGYALAGQDASFVIAGRALNADAGDFLLTGEAADLLASRLLTASASLFDLLGQDANLVHAFAPLLAGAGDFVFTGQDANLIAGGSPTLHAETGRYALTGESARLIIRRKPAPELVVTPSPAGGGGGFWPCRTIPLRPGPRLPCEGEPAVILSFPRPADPEVVPMRELLVAGAPVASGNTGPSPVVTAALLLGTGAAAGYGVVQLVRWNRSRKR